MMVWSKLLSVLCGGVNEVGEVIVDSQVLCIFDQEICDVDIELCKLWEVLVLIMVCYCLVQECVEKGVVQVVEYE